MAICPLIQKECIKNECAWFAGKINQCAIIALGLLTEEIHDMGVFAYDKYVKEED